MSLPVIIDTDPGIDDAVALLLAAASQELDILGITAVAGNVTLDHAVNNAHRILKVAGSEVPVYQGCSRPVIKHLVTAEDVHGPEGLGLTWPEVSYPISGTHGVDFIIEQASSHHNEPLTLCMLGPLTNLALALIKEPEIKKGIGQVVLMGGALNVAGNITPHAEFNFHVDPHAAFVVFESGLPIIMSPLDVTEKASITRPWLEEIKRQKSLACKIVHDMLEFYHAGVGGGLHDPCVIAWLLAPELFKTRLCNVQIEIRDKGQEGKSIADWNDSGEVKAMMDIDREGFFDLLLNRLKRF
ncbi:MAG: nucleoside hydrolase [Endozoicomonas sp.]